MLTFRLRAVSLNRSQAIWTEHWVDTFRRTICRFVEWVCISRIFEPISLFQWKIYISIYHLSARACGISGRCALPQTPRGPSVYHTILFMRSILIILFQYFYQSYTANGNLAGGAETKRPREKSFIRAISQIKNAAKKSSDKGDVRGQEMSENTLLSFFIFSKFTFLRLTFSGSEVRGVFQCITTHLIKCASY